MANIRVEKRAVPGWVPLAAIIALVALALLLWHPWRAADQTGYYNPQQQASTVINYDGHRWIPADVDQAARFPDSQMQRIATVDGRALYTNPNEGLGGGGGGLNVPNRLETQPYGRIYLKMADGRYVPMVWSSEVPR